MGTLARNINQNLSLSERLKQRRASFDSALLLDTSGSMSGLCDATTTKIEALMNIVKTLNCKNMYAFSTYARKLVDNKEHLIAGGGTNLYPALNMLKNDGQKQAIVITDGDITDKDLTLEFLNANPNIKLQILYVGPIDDKPAFLEELASKTNGFCSVENLASPKELAEKIQLLLGSGEKKDNIQL